MHSLANGATGFQSLVWNDERVWPPLLLPILYRLIRLETLAISLKVNMITRGHEITSKPVAPAGGFHESQARSS